MKLGLVILSLLISISTLSLSASSTTTTNISTCPLDLGYVARINMWNSSICQNYPPTQNTTANAKNQCCLTLQSVYGIALSRQLRATSRFQLPDLNTSISCLSDFQSKLNLISLPPNLTSLCFDPSQFVLSPNTCAHIETTRDWVDTLGPSTPVDSACRLDLANLTLCDACVAAGFQVQAQLVSIDGNTSHARDCLYFTIIYAAGVVNEFGPDSAGAMSCIVGLSVELPNAELPNAELPNAELSNAHQIGLESLIVKILVPCLSAFIIFVIGASYCYRVTRKKSLGEDGVESFHDVSGMLTRFSYEDLRSAMKRVGRRLGGGGFGSVHEGVLKNGTRVAVKILESIHQGGKEFTAELNTIGSIHHVNLVRLIGYCIERSNRLLVYEHMCNGSLDNWIFDENRAQALNWEVRRKIVVGIANGLEYLHEHCNHHIIHFDIKPQNILLDENFNVKISDFGLAKLIDRNQSQVYTRLKGTPGYAAPELIRGKNVSVRADVYSFGIVILEIVCGRKNSDFSQEESLIDRVKIKAEEHRLSDLIDDRNQDMQFHRGEAVKMMEIAIQCLQPHFRRPSVSMLVKVFAGLMDIEPVSDYSFLIGDMGIPLEARTSTSASPMASILSGPR